MVRFGFRDPAAQAHLPDRERETWQAFWEEVEGLPGGLVSPR